jgi:NIPSNAP
MIKSKWTLAAFTVAVFAVGWWSGAARGQASTRVYELRTYHCFPGKLPDLQKRFREHTMTIFDRHGMHSVGYWTFENEALKDKTLIYMISHESRDQARKNWAEFSADPEWKQVQTASEANGKIVEKVDSEFLDPTDFSPLK